MNKKKIAVTLLLASFFAMPQTANALVDTNTYISYETEYVPAQAQTITAPGVRTTGTDYFPWGSSGWVACNDVRQDWPFPSVCPDVVQTIYTCANGQTPNSENKCAIASGSGKFKPSAIYEKVTDFLKNLLPIVAGFVLLSIAIFLALKTVRRYGKKLI